MTSSQQILPHVAAAGRAFVLQFYGAIRTLGMHGPENEAFVSVLTKLATTAEQLSGNLGEQVELQFFDDVLFLNGTCLRVNAATADQFSALSRLLADKGVGGISFSNSVNADLFRHWFLRFTQPVQNEEEAVRARLSLDELRDYGIHTSDVRLLIGRQEQDIVRVSSLSFAMQAYARAIVGFREMVAALKADRDPFLGKINLTRVVQDLVDIASTNPGLLLEVIELRRQRPDAFREASRTYAASHAAGTCTLSLLLGVSLELDRLALLDLGMSALLAKIGFALLPESLTESSGQLSAAEKNELKVAMVRAVQTFIQRSRLSDIMMRRVVVAYEHHRPYAGANGQRTDTHVYSRMVAVADAYDAMITPRTWRGALGSDVALENLRKGAGARFDPLIVETLSAVVALPGLR